MWMIFIFCCPCEIFRYTFVKRLAAIRAPGSQWRTTQGRRIQSIWRIRSGTRLRFQISAFIYPPLVPAPYIYMYLCFRLECGSPLSNLHTNLKSLCRIRPQGSDCAGHRLLQKTSHMNIRRPALCAFTLPEERCINGHENFIFPPLQSHWRSQAH